MLKSSLLSGAALVACLVYATGASAAATDTTPKKKAAVHHTHRVAAKGPSAAEEMAAEVAALKAQVEALKEAQAAQAAQSQQTDAQLASMKTELTQAQATAQAAQTQLAEQIQTIPGAVQTQVAQQIDKVKPKTDGIYYKGVKITPGGFVALETVFRSHNEGSDIGSTYSGIPMPNVVSGHTSEERFSARQSRVSLLAQGDVSQTIHLTGYVESDFLGGALTANSNESNSYQPRIRHFFGAIDWDQPWGGIEFLGGQTWSLLTLDGYGITPRSEVTPLTIDAQYVVGFTWARQPQMRVVFNYDKQLWFAVSVENPQTTFYSTGKFNPGVSVVNTIPGGAEFPGSGTTYALSLNKYPDVVGKAVLEENPDGHKLHLEAYGILRSFYDRLTAGGTTGNQNVLGGGFGGAAIFGLVPGVLDLQASGLVGKGIGRYGSGQLPDVSFDTNGNIHPVQESQILLGAIGHVGANLDIYAYAGEERQQAQNYGTSSIYNGVGSLYLNNAGCDLEGSSICGNSTHYEDMLAFGFWHRVYSGKFGKVQWGMQYTHEERHLFPGYGATGQGPVTFNAAPLAREDMFLTSFRYYPF
ncbi:MAG: hypothetical protein KGL69_06140 [Alphaproteobacteria bacterium]|jgi:hypothetical protein|nr:hypothetical protein [Alphaproteobacteria bacterium]